MADIGNPRVEYANDILYRVFDTVTWINASSPNWAASVTMGAQKVEIPVLTSNVGVDYPADADALETGPTIKLGKMSNTEVTRSYIRGYGGINKMMARQSGGGGQADAQVNQEIAIEMALGVDSKIQEAVAATFTADTKNLNDNQLGPLGETGTNAKFISRTFPYGPGFAGSSKKADALELVWDGVQQAALKLAEKKIVVPQAQALGANVPASMAAIMPIGLTNNIVNYLADKGLLQVRADIAAQAGVDRGIFGNQAFSGVAHDTMIWTDLSMTPPSGANNWVFYVVPVNGPLVADFQVVGVSERDFDAGNTDHEFIQDRVAVGLFGVKAVRPEHIVRVEIHADASAVTVTDGGEVSDTDTKAK